MAAERSERSSVPRRPYRGAPHPLLCVSRLLRFYPLDLYPSENKPLVFLFRRFHPSPRIEQWRKRCRRVAELRMLRRNCSVEPCVSRSMQRHGTILSKEIRDDPRRSCDGKS